MRCIVSSAESAGGIINSERNVIARTAITVFASSSMREVLESLVPGFAQASGYQVAVSYDAANLILRRVRNGESADVAVLAGSAIKQLTDLGVVEPASCTDLARSGIGMAVRAGASRPDIGSIEAFKRVLLAAESVAYTTEGASGVVSFPYR
jgi:molybdate transport system substrate-binding protein